jgi:hypothetical protein
MSFSLGYVNFPVILIHLPPSTNTVKDLKLPQDYFLRSFLYCIPDNIHLQITIDTKFAQKLLELEWHTLIFHLQRNKNVITV